MNAAVAHVTLFLLVLILVSKPLGVYIYSVMEGVPTVTRRLLAPVERTLYRWCRIDTGAEMGWAMYLVGLLVFNTLRALTLYLLQRLQPRLPINLGHLGAVAPDSAFNTAISFATNTR